ncbi:sporulation protein [Bacillus timonensis]|nr:sporulation protein [Bacillus timonensis]
MSFFNKVFASMGIGSARVDTKLQNSDLVIGETLNGVVEVTGGNIEQAIDEVYLSLMTTYVKESNDTKVTQTACIQQYKLNEPFTIGVNERKEIPFSVQVPLDTPISLGKTKVWLQTGLDIKNAVDPSDKDLVKIKASPLMASFLNTVYDLGFQLREVECEKAPYTLQNRLPFVQEFEFVPTSGPFRGKLDELEIVFLRVDENKIDILMEVDRRARGLGSFLAEALEMDESKVRFTVNVDDIPNLGDKLYKMIHKFS